ncbi:Heat shock transcription factor, partial [Coemansia sp. S146]
MSGTIIQRDNNMHWHMTMPPFLNKLLIMVEDESSDNLIRWAEDGLSFVVLRRDEFAKEILPRFFKHTNFPSFVRQLNIYGFRKVPHLQQSGLISGAEAESWKFSNKNFRRGRKELLHLIRRKEGTVVNNKDIDGDSEGSIEATCAAQNGRETESSVRPNSQRPASSEETLGSKVRRLEDENRLLRAQARAADEQAKLQQKTIDILVQLV